MANIQPGARKKIADIIAKYKDEPTPLMLVLSDIQTEFGYIPLEVQEVVSEMMNIPVSEIYGVVTFYSFFSLNPKGKYVIGVCLGTACYVKGSQKIIEAFEEELGIKTNQTTSDGLFTLTALRCLGACAIAPAVTINGEVYSRLTVPMVKTIVKKYRDMEAKQNG